MLDTQDIKLLKLLEANAKLTNKELAAQLGLTITPVHERVKKLEREGYVTRYKDRKKVGLSLLVFCSVSLKNHQREFIEKFEQDLRYLDSLHEKFYLGMNVFRTAKGGREKLRD